MRSAASGASSSNGLRYGFGAASPDAQPAAPHRGILRVNGPSTRPRRSVRPSGMTAASRHRPPARGVQRRHDRPDVADAQGLFTAAQPRGTCRRPTARASRRTKTPPATSWTTRCVSVTTGRPPLRRPPPPPPPPPPAPPGVPQNRPPTVQALRTVHGGSRQDVDHYRSGADPDGETRLTYRWTESRAARSRTRLIARRSGRRPTRKVPCRLPYHRQRR